MLRQIKLGVTTSAQKRRIRSLIKGGQITLAGNRNLKIYGQLDCSSGKRMKAENRVFFRNREGAIRQGYRPCGHCMGEEYKKWQKKS
ncbi:Ada metal-binding domain-containing protein [Fodinibius roseus]|uniref:Ada metal-binding domain-containing protein n=1 Tax=Fodinibius roseus TaxID=1194090 RepID=UPI0009343203|nr:Ada metal-binding domain-containing protein [Fodinibius roseus]